MARRAAEVPSTKTQRAATTNWNWRNSRNWVDSCCCLNWSGPGRLNLGMAYLSLSLTALMFGFKNHARSFAQDTRSRLSAETEN